MHKPKDFLMQPTKRNNRDLNNRARTLSFQAVPRSNFIRGIPKHLLIFFGLAVLLNYPWEVAQSPLFNGMGSLHFAWKHCFVSALGDGLIVLIIYLIGCLILRSWTWSYQASTRTYVAAAAIGFVVGTSIEWIALNVLHRWSYTVHMPIFPWLGVGVVPALQFVFLLPLTIYFARKFRR